ncbi:MAG: ATP-binding protein [Phormidesmis sp.]
MKLQGKILSGYVFSLTLVIFVGLWGAFNLRRLGQASEEILQENYLSIRAADGMIDSLERQDSATLIGMLEDSEAGLALFRENEISFLQWLGRAKDNVTLANEAETLATIERDYRSYLLSVDRLRSPSSSNVDTQANTQDANAGTDFATYDRLVRPQFQAVREGAAELRELNQVAMSEASERASATSRQAILSVAIAGLSAATAGFIVSWLLSRNLVRPVEAIRGAAEQIADGNYDVQLPVTSKDELGQLSEEINSMSRRLQAFKALNLDQLMAEKQRSEAIIYSLSDGIVVVNDQLQIVAINPAAASLFETKVSAALNQHFLAVTDNRTLYENLQNAILSKKEKDATDSLKDNNLKDRNASESSDASESQSASNEISIERGETEHYQYLTTPVTTPDNRQLGVVLLLQNVTKFKQIDQLKSEFVMTASHELRTPLTGMAMSIDLLLETAQPKLSEIEAELLQTAQEDVQRLRDLVNDLLDLSKIESGKIELAQIETHPKALVEKAIDLLKIQAEEKSIRLSSRLSDSLKPVRADPNKVTWVLTNLIANALRYADQKIEVTARAHGGWISIAVIDDGPGIDLAYQSKIFDKFVQVKTEKDVGGTGLGLAICKEIIKAHGGTIWVDSTPGAGSSFTFTLPVMTQSLVAV